MRPDPLQTAVSLVFVQTRDGNTGGPNPATFGGGPTDQHLIYEGLSRVAADAVLAGARSVHGEAFFSVWHPELIELRASLGLPRHPAQIVVSKRGSLDFDALLFNVPGHACVRDRRRRMSSAARARRFTRGHGSGSSRYDGGDLSPAFERLRLEEGIQRISAIGGRFTATHLVDAGLAQDIYLTTTSLEGGDPGTPWYSGAVPPRLTAITSKQWNESGATSRLRPLAHQSRIHRASSSAFRQPGVSGSL